MSRKSILCVVVGLGVMSCNPKKMDSKVGDEISGAYAREYSFKVVNQETGIEIGVRTIRDTIFIRPAEDEYEVSNKKWSLNNYDKQGWQNMAHSDDRPTVPYQARFDVSTNTLISEFALPLHVDTHKSKIYKSNSKASFYRKIVNYR